MKRATRKPVKKKKAKASAKNRPSRVKCCGLGRLGPSGSWLTGVAVEQLNDQGRHISAGWCDFQRLCRWYGAYEDEQHLRTAYFAGAYLFFEMTEIILAGRHFNGRDMYTLQNIANELKQFKEQFERQSIHPGVAA